MAQHEEGDRNEYLQQLERSDPWFHVPPVNDALVLVYKCPIPFFVFDFSIIK